MDLFLVIASAPFLWHFFRVPSRAENVLDIASRSWPQPRTHRAHSRSAGYVWEGAARVGNVCRRRGGLRHVWMARCPTSTLRGLADDVKA